MGILVEKCTHEWMRKLNILGKIFLIFSAKIITAVRMTIKIKENMRKLWRLILCLQLMR